MNEERGPVISGPIFQNCVAVLLSDCSLLLKKMLDALLGRRGGTPSLQTKTTEVRNVYMV